MIVQIIILVMGFVLLVKGADFFVDGAASVARKLGIPQIVIGLTIVAIGTSLPEAAVSISATISGNTEIAIGNVVGSNIFNVLVILGITALLINVPIKNSTLRIDIPCMIGISILLAGVGINGAINRAEGSLLLLSYVIFLAILVKRSIKGEGDELVEGEIKDLSIIKCIVYLVVGGFVIVLGSNLVVESATYIARAAGLSERIIGLTIVAFGTSLPELVTSVTAARKGDADIAIGNIVGSNIFNIAFIVGASACIMPLSFASKFMLDTILAIACGFILLAGVVKTKELRKSYGFFMLMIYFVYLIYLIE